MKEELTVILICVAPFIGMTILFGMMFGYIFPILAAVSTILPYVFGIILAGAASFGIYYLIIFNFY